MTNYNENTDEDKQIARLQVHRDLIQWVIDELEKEGIEALRTSGGNSKGDILIVDENQVTRVKEILRQFRKQFNR